MLRIDFRDGAVTIGPGEMFVVPKGKEHKPFAEKDKDELLYYKEAKDGQILEEGINELIESAVKAVRKEPLEAVAKEIEDADPADVDQRLFHGSKAFLSRDYVAAHGIFSAEAITRARQAHGSDPPGLHWVRASVLDAAALAPAWRRYSTAASHRSARSAWRVRGA